MILDRKKFEDDVKAVTNWPYALPIAYENLLQAVKALSEGLEMAVRSDEVDPIVKESLEEILEKVWGKG